MFECQRALMQSRRVKLRSSWKSCYIQFVWGFFGGLNPQEFILKVPNVSVNLVCSAIQD